MLRRLIPRDEQFFDLFNQLSNHLSTTAKMLNELFGDPGRVAEHVRRIKDEDAGQIVVFDRFIAPWAEPLERLIRPPFGLSLIAIGRKEANTNE